MFVNLPVYLPQQSLVLLLLLPLQLLLLLLPS
jgi:hypothetical protein